MYLASARDIGHVVRDRRLELSLSQAELADAAGVSRRWLLALETGKPSAQLDLVLRTLAALGLILDVRPEVAVGGLDLDDVVAAHEGVVDD